MKVYNKKIKQQIAEISNRVCILNENEYTIDLKKFQCYNQKPISSLTVNFKTFGNNKQDKQDQIQSLISHLSSKIYSCFYCGIEENDNQLLPSKKERDLFMDDLSAANKSNNGYDPQWMIYSKDHAGNVFAQKNGQLRWLQPNSYQLTQPGNLPAEVNTHVNIIRQKENKDSQQVFYYVFGNEMLGQQISMARVYFNIQPEGATTLVDQITTWFNEYKVPFSFKCLNHPNLYNRRDNAVLYLDKAHLDLALILLKEVSKYIAPYLNKEVPWFTYPLFDGISYAEDPGNGESFGMSRSTLLAKALWHSFEIKKTEDKSDFINGYLEQNGLPADRFYLNTHTAKLPVFPTF